MLGAAVGLYAAITPKDGQRVRLSMGSGYEDDPVLKDLPVVATIEISIEMNGMANIKVDLDMTYDQGMRFLNSPLCWPGSLLETFIGYPDLGLYTPVYAGVCFKPEVTITPDGVQVSLAAVGTEQESARRQSVRTWKGVKAHAMVTEIIEKYGKVADIDPDTKAKLDVDLEYEQGQLSDWAFLTKICNALAGADLFSFTDPKTRKPVVRVVSRSKWLSATPQRKFIMRGKFDPQAEPPEYPLLSFDSPTDWRWMAASSRGILSRDIDPDSKEAKQTEVGAEVSEMPRGGVNETAGKKTESDTNDAGTMPKFDPDTETGKHLPQSYRDQMLAQRLQAQADQATKMDGVQANCTTLGVPGLLPGQVVELVMTNGGDSSLLDGNYGVLKVVHTGGGDGWETTFECFKGAFGKNVQVGNPVTAPTNTQPAAGGGEDIEVEAEPPL